MGSASSESRGFSKGLQISLLCLLIIAAIRSGPLSAQVMQSPVLHLRNEPSRQPQIVTEIHGRPVLPDEASGEYGFGQPGEVIQIILEPPGRLTGYISRFGNHESDQGTPLTFLFLRTSVAGEQIQFETNTVHGVWYSFRGSITRGTAETRSQEGYYRLSGLLEEHDLAAGSVQKRNLDLKLSRSSSSF
jgi:hypothetical protein